ncbi:LysR family transcriptional regulator [Pararoseomonas indoligenes]|uniref:LysR family transcriptional regulator n=1 Tax=Roseomonas indoligenes TaxID=2820811 RepID=A0A940MX79_9PROT|nr:LysR family transcriptional regulator [Pararoseomonas indoligenes]MBP0495064.1 LysR family transcriptional regulator [Pararoseomonas indoligenes]
MAGARRGVLSEKQRLSLANRIAGLDQRRLLYLHEATSAGSVRGGAERLGVSPSALSRQIAKMETDLGIALLERHGRGVRPTEAGDLLDSYFTDQRGRLDGVIAQLQELVEARGGQVSVGMGEGFLGAVMGPPLRAFALAHPDLRLDVQVGSTDHLVARLLDDTIQMALLYNLPPEPKLQSHASRRHAMRIIVNPTHPLRRLGRPIEVDDLRHHALGLLPGSYGVRQVLLSAEHRHRVRLVPRLTTNSSRALLRFAEEWDGVIITTEFAVDQELRDGRLVALEAGEPFLEGSEAHLVTRRGRRLSPAAQDLLRHLRAQVALIRP